MTISLRNTIHDQPIWKRRVVGGSLLTAGFVAAIAIAVAAGERPVSASPSSQSSFVNRHGFPSAISEPPRLLADRADDARAISPHGVTTAEYLVSEEDQGTPKILLIDDRATSMQLSTAIDPEPVWLTGTVIPIAE